MSLLDMPAELTVAIASHLSTYRFCKLRCVCKQIAAHLDYTFKSEFFAERRVMLSRFSLDTLIDISRHPRLSQAVKKVVITLHGCLNDSSYYLSGHEEVTGGLLRSGLVKERLIEGFCNLKNLQTVQLRDWNSRGRYREGRKARWRGYGWSERPDSHAIYPDSNRVLTVLFFALGQSGTGPTELDIRLPRTRRNRNGPVKGPDPLKISMGPLAGVIHPVLANLKRLYLYTWDYAGDPPDTLLQFLNRCPNIDFLFLNNNGLATSRGGDLAIMWLASTENHPYLNLAQDSPWRKDTEDLISYARASMMNVTYVTLHLRDLELEETTLTIEMITCIITRFDLRHLALRRCCLPTHSVRYEPYPGHGIIRIPRRPEEVTEWTRLFMELSASLSPSAALASMEVRNPGEFDCSSQSTLSIEFLGGPYVRKFHGQTDELQAWLIKTAQEFRYQTEAEESVKLELSDSDESFSSVHSYSTSEDRSAVDLDADFTGSSDGASAI